MHLLKRRVIRYFCLFLFLLITALPEAGSSVTAVRCRKLHEDLKDSDPEVRSDALLALGESGSDKEVSFIVPLLRDKSMLVRHCAAEALAQIGGEEARAVFAGMLFSDSVEKKRVGAAGLARIGAYGESFKRLIELLDDKNWQVRWAAVLALGRAGDARAVSAIRHLYMHDTYKKSDDSYPVREAAAAALKNLETRIRWWNSLSEAVAAAKSRDCNVLMLFSIKESNWCKKFEKETIRIPGVSSAMNGFACILLDPTEYSQTADTYRIKGVPSIVIVDSGGNEIDHIGGYVDAAQLLAALGSAGVGHDGSFTALQRKYENNPHHAETGLQFAAKLMDREDYDRAADILQSMYLAGLYVDDSQKNNALFQLGYCFGLLGNHQESVKYFSILAKRDPDYDKMDKVLYCMGLSYLYLGRIDQSLKMMDAVLSRHPASDIAAAAGNVRKRIMCYRAGDRFRR